MYEQLSHGGNHGALVGFAAISEADHIITDDGAVDGSRLSGHVEAFAHFGAASLDRAFGGALATVAIEGSQAGECDELVAA